MSDILDEMFADFRSRRRPDVPVRIIAAQILREHAAELDEVTIEKLEFAGRQTLKGIKLVPSGGFGLCPDARTIWELIGFLTLAGE